MNVMDIAITSLDDIAAFDVVSGAFLFLIDELQSASINNTEEKQDIIGKQGRKLSSLKRNKAVTITGNNGLVSGGMMEKQVGSKFEDKVTQVMWTDYLTVSSNAATTNYKAVGTEGAEIIEVSVRNSDGTQGAKLTQGAEVSANVFTYDPATKAMAFSGLADGTEIVVYYKRNIQANTLQNLSDHYSGKCELYINATGEDKCANVYRVQIHVPKADFSGNFNLDLGDSQTIHAFEAEALAGACGGNGSLWDYIVFGASAADAA